MGAGVDKSLLRIDGRPLVVRVVDALLAAGAGTVTVVGGDAAAITALGLAFTADRWPGAGPLAGIATALASSPEGTEVVAVLGCDLLAPDPGAITVVVEALLAAPLATAAAVPVVEGRRQWLHAAWRPGIAAVLDRALAAGERSIHGLVDTGAVIAALVDGLDPADVADVDTPADLPPGARRGVTGPGR
jgi:molybdopterin-guanine dinucleotide biosynthesis protein A